MSEKPVIGLKTRECMTSLGDTTTVYHLTRDGLTVAEIQGQTLYFEQCLRDVGCPDDVIQRLTTVIGEM